MAEFLSSQRGAQRLVYHGFMYHCDRRTEDKTFWRCFNRQEMACKGRVHETDGQFRLVTEHNHAPSHNRAEAEMMRTNMINRSIMSNDTSRAIYSAAVQGASPGAIIKLPKYASMQQSIARKRKAVNLPHPNPQSLEEIDVPLELRVTANGENFLLYDSGNQDLQRILIFGTDRNIAILRLCEVWLADASFKVAPALFYQIWVIHGLYRNRVVPLVYVLMPAKSGQMYAKSLEFLSQQNLRPQTIIIDFEKAEVTSLRTAFPMASIHGCFFHFAQSIWRKIHDIGWAVRYREDQNFAQLLLYLFFILMTLC